MQMLKDIAGGVGKLGDCYLRMSCSVNSKVLFWEGLAAAGEDEGAENKGYWLDLGLLEMEPDKEKVEWEGS